MVGQYVCKTEIVTIKTYPKWFNFLKEACGSFIAKAFAFAAISSLLSRALLERQATPKTSPNPPIVISLANLLCNLGPVNRFFTAVTAVAAVPGGGVGAANTASKLTAYAKKRKDVKLYWIIEILNKNMQNLNQNWCKKMKKNCLFKNDNLIENSSWKKTYWLTIATINTNKDKKCIVIYLFDLIWEDTKASKIWLEWWFRTEFVSVIYRSTRLMKEIATHFQPVFIQWKPDVLCLHTRRDTSNRWRNRHWKITRLAIFFLQFESQKNNFFSHHVPVYYHLL